MEYELDWEIEIAGVEVCLYVVFYYEEGEQSVTHLPPEQCCPGTPDIFEVKKLIVEKCDMLRAYKENEEFAEKIQDICLDNLEQAC